MRVLFYIYIFLLFACKQEQTGNEHAEHNHVQKDTAAAKYTCPMHPQVIKDAPGTCPVCGMELVPVTHSNATESHIMLSNSQFKLANITTQKVSMRAVGETAIINARLSLDEERTNVISSRTAGRIEKLFVKETGRTVKQGEPLYEIYSENLLTLQREYLLAKEQFEALGKQETRYGSFFKAAERKLLLYGLTSEQIARLTNVKSLQPRITFLAPASGIVTEINVSEGQYIAEGSILYRIENIDNLWVEADLYPHETALVKTGDKIRLRISGFEAEPAEATITFLSPEYKGNTQVTVVRAALKNADHKYTPGMQAQVMLSHSSRQSLAIPIDAVIRTGKGTHVYVQHGNNTFKPQMVKTGLEDFDQVEITEGLHEGDTVAVSGAYLLYSEMILKNGTDPMAGHSGHGVQK
ncbi:efflux RND transporter periplasmic adaptor subunit [Ohtaekwangia koreensis]|uniref:Membrane fusion protein, Cu(I)/Ag(I) efflux system n=1 Tax=Ohtaekwangia koreensis TaxID=688867 RepID=A0A1T5IW13_9BACT|nr:efflux RND transporter periplasmic adaptor subunit [Ohtaekwangia koreensis]SKC43272.1 membrane fusion protein, Cu(I)/Ag(I) efflux system [Ohtaekwangia koreensis]